MNNASRKVMFVIVYGARALVNFTAFALITIAIAMQTLSVSAQTPTAAPTLIPITVNTNQLMSQVNTWVLALDDIIFLGVAIAIAIAILLFIGKTVLTAFRGSGGS